MDSILILAQIVALVSLAALCVYLIVVLVRVKAILVDVEKDVKEISSKALPILDNVEYISARAKIISESVEDQVVTVRDSLSSLRRVADDVLNLERKVQQRVEGPILETLGTIAAVIHGVRVFVTRLRA